MAESVCKFAGLCLAGLTLSLSGPPASAQEQGQPAAPEAQAQTASAETATRQRREAAGIEEIVVTSRKREERIQDVPIAITAFDVKSLEMLQTRDISELNALAPSLSIQRSDITPGAMYVYVRGIGTGDVEKTADPGVMVVVDGVARGTMAGTALDSFDIEQVEVLRGPQGTLYGRNTIGGAINIRRSRPTGQFGGNVGVTVGKFHRVDYEAVLNLPAFFEEKLSVKLAWALFKDNGPFRSRWWGDYGPEKDRMQVSTTLLYRPTDSMEWLLTLEKFRDRGGSTRLTNVGVAAGVIPPPPPEAVTGLDRHLGDQACNFFGYCNWPNPSWGSLDNDKEKESDLTLDYDAVTLEGNWDLETVTLTSVTGWLDEEERIYFDWDGSPYPLTHSDRPQDYRQFSQELRAAGTALDDRLDYTAGLYFFWMDNESRQFLDIGVGCFAIFGFGSPACAADQFRFADGSFFIVHPRQEGKQDTHAYAAFAQLTYDILPNLTATLGGRWTRETKKFIGKDGPDENLPFDDRASKEVTWREFTPRYGLDWRITDDFLAYVSYSVGFRSGVFNGRNTREDLIGPADPEKVYAWEVGFKSDWLGNRLRVNAAAYRNEYKDKHEGVVLLDPKLGTVTLVNNAAEALLQGYEVEVTAMPLSWLTLGMNYAYFDGEYDEFTAELVAGRGPTDNSDLPIRTSPEYSISAFASATFPLGPGALNLFYSYRHRKPVPPHWTADPRSDDKLEDLHDASVSYELDWGGRTYRTSLFVNNLTNVDTGLAHLLLTPLGNFGYPIVPRRWGLEVSMAF